MAESSSNPPSNSSAPIAEIELGPSKTDQFLDNHQTKIIILAILIALGVVAYVISQGLAEAEAQEAGAALLSAEQPADYQTVIKTWPESHAAASASILLADLQWPDSQPDSIATLEEFINNHPEHPTLATAKVSLGLRLLEQGKADEAGEILAEVADGDSYIAPLACIALGDIAKEAGESEEATQRYEKAQQGPSELGNAYKELATSRLLLVNAKPPVKIKPTLPEPKISPPVSPPVLEIPDTPAPKPAAPAVPKPAAPQNGN